LLWTRLGVATKAVQKPSSHEATACHASYGVTYLRRGQVTASRTQATEQSAEMNRLALGLHSMLPVTI
jgi:hypothetical protein